MCLGALSLLFLFLSWFKYLYYLHKRRASNEGRAFGELWGGDGNEGVAGSRSQQRPTPSPTTWGEAFHLQVLPPGRRWVYRALLNGKDKKREVNK